MSFLRRFSFAVAAFAFSTGFAQNPEPTPAKPADNPEEEPFLIHYMSEDLMLGKQESAIAYKPVIEQHLLELYPAINTNSANYKMLLFRMIEAAERGQGIIDKAAYKRCVRFYNKMQDIGFYIQHQTFDAEFKKNLLKYYFDRINSAGRLSILEQKRYLAGIQPGRIVKTEDQKNLYLLDIISKAYPWFKDVPAYKKQKLLDAIVKINPYIVKDPFSPYSIAKSAYTIPAAYSCIMIPNDLDAKKIVE